MKNKAIKTILSAMLVLPLAVAGCGGHAAETAPAAPAAESSSSSKNDQQSIADSESVMNSDDSKGNAIDDYDTEEYSDLNEQGFRSVLKHPLSTFAADVDTASYSNMRRLLSEGHSVYDLPEGSVRIEELINYFDYDYDDPKGLEPFGVNFEIGECPWNPDAKLASIGLKTEDIELKEMPASNLVFLIDVSGSMSDYDKLPLLRESFHILLDKLSAKDRVSIVTYSDEVKVVCDGVSGSRKSVLDSAIAELYASGGTNGGKGLQEAYRIAEKNFIEGGNNRIILATDGDLNIGLTTVDELENYISKKKESGVFFSVLGFGTGNIKDNRMETLSDKGNGNYSYIDSIKEANKILVDEFSANMLTVCKDVKLQVEFNPEVVKEYKLIGYGNRAMKNKDFNNDSKDGGEIGAGHEVTALYELILEQNIQEDDYDIKELRYADQFKKKSKDVVLDDDTEIMTLNIRYKKPGKEEKDSSLLTYPLTHADSRCAGEISSSDDFIFQSAVAEFGLIASNSEYKEDADLYDVLVLLEQASLFDEYKVDFMDLVTEQIKNFGHSYK